MIRLPFRSRLLRREAWARDPKLNLIVGLWLGLAVLVENYVPLSTAILKATSWSIIGLLWERLGVIFRHAQFQDSQSAVWIYFILSSLPMTFLFVLSGGLRTYNRVIRRVLGAFVFGSLVALSGTFLLGWITVFRPTDTDFWVNVFYRTPIGASLVIGSSAFVLTYSFGYLVWRIGGSVRALAHFNQGEGHV